MKGLCASYVVKYLYNLLLPGLQQVVELYHSNAYGRTYKDAHKAQVRCDPMLCWGCVQLMTLYTLLQVLVVTTHGLTLPYRIPRGLVQGRGMGRSAALHPLHYINVGHTQ